MMLLVLRLVVSLSGMVMLLKEMMLGEDIWLVNILVKN